MSELWSEIVPSAIKMPYHIYKNRYSIQYWYKRLEVSFNKGKTNVVVVGRPSVGKTILTKHLNEKISIQTDKPETSSAVEVEVLKLKKWSKIIRTIPGQSSQERYQGLEEAFDKHYSLEGVIYVTDWGYTKVRDRLIEKKLIEEKGIENIQALRNHYLKLELDDFNHILNKIKQAKANKRGPNWLLIAVNKVDLFYDKIDEAQKYYHPDFKSDFTSILNNFLSCVGDQNLKYISLPVACWEEDFIWNSEKIETKLGGMDNKRVLFSNFYKKLTELSS